MESTVVKHALNKAEGRKGIRILKQRYRENGNHKIDRNCGDFRNVENEENEMGLIE